MTTVDNLCVHILLFFKGLKSSPEEPTSAAQLENSSNNRSKHMCFLMGFS